MTNDVLKNVALTVREEVLDKGNTKSPLIKSIPSRVLLGQLHCKGYRINHMESLFWVGGFIYNNKTRRKFLSKIFKFLHRLISLIMFGMSLC